MDPTSSLGRIFLGENVYRSPKTEEVSERYISPCFVNGLDAYDGEINLALDENLISNEFVMKLCLDYEVKKGNKVVKKELIVALSGELYFVKFIINLKEDDIEPGVILGKSFKRLVNEIVDFANGVITVYPEHDPFEDDSKKTKKSMDDWDQLLDFNFDDIPQLDGEELSPSVCKMRKSRCNKKRATENLNLFYPNIGPSSSTGRHLTQEEAVKEALALRISQMFALLEEVRPVLETMAYNNKYKKVLDEIWKDKVKLVGMITEEEEKAIIKVKGEVLKEEDEPGAFIFPIRLEGTINENALADTRSDINTMPYRIYEKLGIEKIKKESDNNDEEEYEIKRNKFKAPMYGPKLAVNLNCNDPAERSLALQATMGGNDDEAESSRSKRSRQYETVEEVLLPQVHHEFVLWECCNKEAKSRMGCDGEINKMLRIKLREAGSNEEIFTFVAWIRAFNINEPIHSELCHEFYSTYEFDKVCADVELQTKKIIKFRLGGRAHSLTLLDLSHRLGLYHADELDEEGFDVYVQGGLPRWLLAAYEVWGVSLPCRVTWEGRKVIQHGRMILESVEYGLLLWPTVEEDGVTRLKKYSELSAAEAIQADCDMLMQGTSLTKQERECKLYDEFDKFVYRKEETLRDFYLRFSLLLNDMNMYNMKLEQFQVNTKFLNTLPPEWRPSSSNMSISYPVNDIPSTVNHNAYMASSSAPQIDYAPMVHHSSEFSSPETGLVVPVFQKGGDPIDAINHMMSFLTAVVTSRYPAINNHLRTSSNPRQQATINNGRITIQPIQGRQNSMSVGSSRPFVSGSGGASGKQRVIVCYNCKGEGHMSKQCTKPKRKRDAKWFKDKVLLVQPQANEQVLQEEELEFLEDP
uniref:Retrotransposon Orf1 n=1 Tax=Tanacetum cinerariifolium TaxID=118510 RepID=A0A6L2LMT2_TANCI|nr:retrotransposon Orf1 [Tanacetum cinerariifolium]